MIDAGYSSRSGGPTGGRINRLAADWMVVLVRIYQGLFRLLFTTQCRFEPTCSEYAAQALLGHGIWRGLRLTVRRLARCHPWGGFGCDPVPPESAGADRLLRRHAESKAIDLVAITGSALVKFDAPQPPQADSGRSNLASASESTRS